MAFERKRFSKVVSCGRKVEKNKSANQQNIQEDKRRLEGNRQKKWKRKEKEIKTHSNKINKPLTSLGFTHFPKIIVEIKGFWNRIIVGIIT